MAQIRFNKTLVRSIIIGILILFAGRIISGRLSKKDQGAEVKISFGERQVKVFKANPGDIPLNIELSGRLRAASRMELFAEVNGVLESQQFRAGQRFQTGQVLARINDDEFRAQVRAQKSALMAQISQAMPDITFDYPDQAAAWKQWLTSIDPNRSLPELPEGGSQAFRQFISARNILSTYYNIQSLEERLKKYEIRAPFSGVLSEALIDPGALVRSGQKIGTLVSSGVFEMEAAVTRSDLRLLAQGRQVKLMGEDGKSSYTGTVVRINEVVNPNTQLVSVYLKVQGQGLKEGMFMRASIDGGTAKEAIRVKRQLCEGGKIYLTGKDSSLFKQEVRIISYQGEYAVIDGVEAGAWVPSSYISGAFEGLKVVPVEVSVKN